MTNPEEVIIYIAGYGRSGSTLLDIVLGEDVISVGEIGLLFHHLYLHNTKCSCGENLNECPFWETILAACINPKKSKQYMQLFKRHQSILSLFTPFLFRAQKDKKDFIAINRCLFNKISESSSSGVIVDSSKTDRYKFFRPYRLKKNCGYKVKIVHLIRDPRSIYESVSRGSNIKMEKGEDPKMSFPLLRTVCGWVLSNAAASLNRALIGRKNSIVLRYEDFLADPVNCLQYLEKRFNLDLSVSKAKIESKNCFYPKHLCGGNRLARQKEIKLESGYLQAPNISRWKQVLIWFLTFPFSCLYGYSIVVEKS